MFLSSDRHQLFIDFVTLVTLKLTEVTFPGGANLVAYE